MQNLLTSAIRRPRPPRPRRITFSDIGRTPTAPPTTLLRQAIRKCAKGSKRQTFVTQTASHEPRRNRRVVHPVRHDLVTWNHPPKNATRPMAVLKSGEVIGPDASKRRNQIEQFPAQRIERLACPGGWVVALGGDAGAFLPDAVWGWDPEVDPRPSENPPRPS